MRACAERRSRVSEGRSTLTGRSSGDQIRQAISVPALGLSTVGLSHFDAHDLVLMGIELGVRHIETSPIYDNESAVGGAFAVADVERADLCVSSEIGCHDGDSERLFDSFDVTLDLLGLRRLDLLLLRPDGSEADWIAACDALHGLREEGVVDRLGLALDEPGDIPGLARHAPFDVVAMPSHPGLSQSAIRQWCSTEGWGFLARSPFGPEGESDLVLADSVITELAATHGISVAQVVLAWAVAPPGSAVVFPSSSPDDLFDHWESRRVELGLEEILAIDAMDQASA